jgi:hypothetical protein
MKRIFSIIAVVVLSLAGSSLVMAQSMDPSYLGTWQLNVAKSKYTHPTPKSLTRTVETQGNAYKATFDGINADGSRIAFTVTSNFDGKPVPISGYGVPGGADLMAVKRVNSRTTTITMMKGTTVVGTAKYEVSKDGKVTTQIVKMTDASGKQVTDMGVYDRQ